MKYRNFAVATWSDDIVLSMSPEQKLLFLYLYTSPYTSPCGIFKLSMRTAGFHLGYIGDPFESALKGLCGAYPDFVAYDPATGEVALLQYPKQLLITASGKALAISQKEVEKVESQHLLRAMISQNSAGLSRPYLAQLRRLQMEKINGKSVNALLCGDVVQVVDIQQVKQENEIEIESKDILSFSSENDDASFLPEMDIPKRDVDHTEPAPAAPRAGRKKKASPAHVGDVINHLNAVAGTSFRPSTGSTISAINARIEEGYTVDDFKAVIDCKAAQWKGDSEMQRYLRPETLFRPAHFESYLQESKSAPRANTDAALKDVPGIDDQSAAQYGRFILHIQENYPALWRSACRVFSQSEYLDYLQNKSIPGIALNIVPAEKRAHLSRIMQELSASENKRKKYGTVWQAYETTMRALLNGKKVEI
jgi:uncharacterized phage protein (TIGR02220 family)